MNLLQGQAIFLVITALSLIIIFNGCEPAERNEEAVSDNHNLRLHWTVKSNFEKENQAIHEMTLLNEGDETLNTGWTLYFNFMRLIEDAATPEGAAVSDHAAITHINGDFYRLQPDERFPSLEPGEEARFTFVSQGSAVLKIDGPDGAYIEQAGGEVVPVEISIEPFTRKEQVHRSQDDAVPLATAENLFEKSENLSLLPEDELSPVVPTPSHLSRRDGAFTITGNTGIHFQNDLENEARLLAETLEPLLGTELSRKERPPAPDEKAIELIISDLKVGDNPKTYGDEAYLLEISDSGVSITGTDEAGVFYGIQTLKAVIPVETWASLPTDGDDDNAASITIDAMSVADAPGFEYRGLHLDVSRNFHSAEQVKRLLDVMSFYKLNRFHFHLTDDEGWRLAVDAFPELTEIGGRRGHTHDEKDHLLPSYGSGPDPDVQASKGSGWYSREEYVDILRYATDRHIKVIPEVDVPGHARAAKVAMKNRHERLMDEGRDDEAEAFRIHDPADTSEYRSIQRWTDNVINVCQESTYRFLREVYDEIIDMHREANAPLATIHVGGDEVPSGVWEGSPVCHDLVSREADLYGTDDLMDYFFKRTRADLEDRGLTMSAWEEFSLIPDPETGETIPNPLFAGESIPYVWSNIWGTGTESYSYQLANAGYDIVMSHASNFYFDLSYQKHPEESGLYWAGFVDTPDPFSFIPFELYKSGVTDYLGNPMPEDRYDDFPRLTEEGREHILGLQAQLWGETFRTPDRVEYMALPRLISLAERAWVPEEEWMEIESREERLDALSHAWNEFANRLGQRELPRLDHLNGGYGYRVPPPGARVQDGTLEANVAYPGLEIRYTLDGSEPDEQSNLYESPVPVDSETEIRLRTFDQQGRSSRTSSIPDMVER